MPNEPLADALDMANALLRLLNDLHDDDPGDNETHFAPQIAIVRTKAQDLVNAIQELSR